LLIAVSSVQFAAGVVGMGVAVKRRYPYDFLMLHGKAERVARDTVLMGSAFSAPISMLGAQAWATLWLLRSPDNGVPARVLGGLGAAMVPGYLGEARVRARLSRAGRRRGETPLVVAGLLLAGVMAALGLGPRRSVHHA